MNPVLADVYRGDTVESRHRGAVVAINADGDTILELGDVNALVFPRSALKPVQVLPLIESGALERFSITERELALACASHSGEAMHLEVLSAWLQRLELDDSCLECGPSLPLDTKTSNHLLQHGGGPSRALHNCSGKHTGMLAMAAFLEESLQGYSEYDHATQQAWMVALSELSAINITDMPWDKDGCGLPAVALPLQAFARAFVPFTSQYQASGAQYGVAAARAAKAMRTHPQLVAGTGRCCTASMQGVGDLLVKTGAEGVYIAVAIDAGLVIALKVDDGATRASEVLLGAALRQLGAVSASQYDALARWYTPQLLNSQEVMVGSIRPSSAWREI